MTEKTQGNWPSLSNFGGRCSGSWSLVPDQVRKKMGYLESTLILLTLVCLP